MTASISEQNDEIRDRIKARYLLPGSDSNQ